MRLCAAGIVAQGAVEAITGGLSQQGRLLKLDTSAGNDVLLPHRVIGRSRNRSMEGDSELNICHVDGDATKDFRRDLWDLHTNGKGTDDSPVEAFNQWGKIVTQNTDNQGKHLAPVASLVGFMRTSNVRTYVD